jgi:hypothetical protein
MYEEDWLKHEKNGKPTQKNNQMIKSGLLKKLMARFSDTLDVYVYSDTGETSTGELFLVFQQEKTIIGSINLHSGEVSTKS